MIQRATLICNPHSGRAKTLGLSGSQLLEMIRMHGIHVEELVVDDFNGVADEVASLPDESLCIVAGGDGTLYNVLQGGRCFHVTFGILPLGTANNLANTVGIPQDIDEAIETIVRGHIHRIDMGRADGRIFTQAAGVGFHAQAFHIYGHHREKSFSDGVHALLTTMRTWHPHRMTIESDSTSIVEEVTQVTVANTPIYGHKIAIAPDAELDDGMLDVVIIKNCSTKIEVVECIVKLMQGIRLDTSKVTRVTAKYVKIFAPDGVEIPVHADAEPIGYTPVTIEVLPSCLKLIVPA